MCKPCVAHDNSIKYSIYYINVQMRTLLCNIRYIMMRYINCKLIQLLLFMCDLCSIVAHIIGICMYSRNEIIILFLLIWI